MGACIRENNTANRSRIVFYIHFEKYPCHENVLKLSQTACMHAYTHTLSTTSTHKSSQAVMEPSKYQSPYMCRWLRKWIQMSKIHILSCLYFYVVITLRRRVSNFHADIPSIFFIYKHFNVSNLMKNNWFCTYSPTSSFRHHCQNNDLPHLDPFS